MTMNQEPARETDDWRPFCGFVYPLTKTAGTPVICTRQPHDTMRERHYNEDTGFHWWQQYEETGFYRWPQPQGGKDDSED